MNTNSKFPVLINIPATVDSAPFSDGQLETGGHDNGGDEEHHEHHPQQAGDDEDTTAEGHVRVHDPSKEGGDDEDGDGEEQQEGEGERGERGDPEHQGKGDDNQGDDDGVVGDPDQGVGEGDHDDGHGVAEDGRRNEDPVAEDGAIRGQGQGVGEEDHGDGHGDGEDGRRDEDPVAEDGATRGQGQGGDGEREHGENLNTDRNLDCDDNQKVTDKDARKVVQNAFSYLMDRRVVSGGGKDRAGPIGDRKKSVKFKHKHQAKRGSVMGARRKIEIKGRLNQLNLANGDNSDMRQVDSRRRERDRDGETSVVFDQQTEKQC